MARSAIDVIASDTALRAAWRRVSKGKLAGPSAFRPGVDGESLDTFAQSLETRLAHISSSLLARRFVFSELQPFFVPKPNGKRRLICVPTVRDRVVQRAILDFLTPKHGGWLANGVSYGFVPDLGVPDAVKLAVKYRAERPWVFKTDIAAFFDRIDRPLLLGRVHSQIRHKSLHELIESAIGCEIHVVSDDMRAKLKVLDIRPGRGIRQGMPLSPFFANMMLAPFDRACKARNLAAIRYADDLIFFAKTEVEALEVQEFCLEQLSALRLEIPELGEGSKTQIYMPEQPAEFLGVELRVASAGGYEVAISSEHMAQIKQRIYTFGNLNELHARGLNVTKFGNALRSATAAYGATYSFCSNATDLLNHLSSWEQETIMKIVKSLGIDLAKMTAEQRWFLGLD